MTDPAYTDACHHRTPTAAPTQRLIAKETGLYPADNITAAHVDEIMDAIEDLPGLINGAGRGLEQAEKEAARRTMVTEGAASVIIGRIEKVLGETGDGAGHAVGSELTVADLAVYGQFTHLFSGFFDGLNVDMLKTWPNIQSIRKAVASHPKVKAFYDEGAGKAMPEPALTLFKSVRDL